MSSTLSFSNGKIITKNHFIHFFILHTDARHLQDIYHNCVFFLLRSFMFMTQLYFLPFTFPYSTHSSYTEMVGMQTHPHLMSLYFWFILPKNTFFLSGWLIQGLPPHLGSFSGRDTDCHKQCQKPLLCSNFVPTLT